MQTSEHLDAPGYMPEMLQDYAHIYSITGRSYMIYQTVSLPMTLNDFWLF